MSSDEEWECADDSLVLPAHKTAKRRNSDRSDREEPTKRRRLSKKVVRSKLNSVLHEIITAKFPNYLDEIFQSSPMVKRSERYSKSVNKKQSFKRKPSSLRKKYNLHYHRKVYSRISNGERPGILNKVSKPMLRTTGGRSARFGENKRHQQYQRQHEQRQRRTTQKTSSLVARTPQDDNPATTEISNDCSSTNSSVESDLDEKLKEIFENIRLQMNDDSCAKSASKYRSHKPATVEDCLAQVCKGIEMLDLSSNQLQVIVSSLEHHTRAAHLGCLPPSSGVPSSAHAEADVVLRLLHERPEAARLFMAYMDEQTNLLCLELKLLETMAIALSDESSSIKDSMQNVLCEFLDDMKSEREETKPVSESNKT